MKFFFFFFFAPRRSEEKVRFSETDSSKQGFLTNAFPQKPSIELAGFSITRHWYDVQAGVNDSFTVYRPADQQTFTVTIPPSWYTINQNNVGSGTTIDDALTALLTNILG